jgi:hypothetical protein
MRPRTQHDKSVTVTCSDNGKSNIAEVLSYSPTRSLIVSLNRTIRLEMKYNAKSNLYIANQSGLEFVSKGPTTTIVPGVNRR